jgi:hypothetical protein
VIKCKKFDLNFKGQSILKSEDDLEGDIIWQSLWNCQDDSFRKKLEKDTLLGDIKSINLMKEIYGKKITEMFLKHHHESELINLKDKINILKNKLKELEKNDK